MRGLKSLTLFGITILSLPVLATPADGTDPVKYNLRIEKQSLSTALQEFATQSGVQIIFFAKVTDGIEAPSLKGKFTAADAVARLLDHSDLTFQQLNPKTIQVEPKAATNDLKRNLGSSFVEPASPLHLAQSDAPSPQDSGQPAQSPTENTQNSKNQSTVSVPSEEGKEHEAKLAEVVVTGSHIRGARNDTSPLTVLDHEYIERSGYSNMMQLVQSLPMNFSGGSGGSSEMATFAGNSFAGQNLTRGTGFNLHGLSSVATLTLINGHRVAPSGEGEFVDISTIPLAAIDHIEILADGASAIYGADAVSGVVNIILRKDFQGAQTDVHYGTAGIGEGGTNEQQVSQTLGTAWASGNALAVAQFYKRAPLDARDRDYIVAAGGAFTDGPTYLLPERKQSSLLLNLDQKLPGNFDLTATAQYAHEQVSEAMTDPSPEVNTNHPVSNNWSASVALGYQAFGDWRVELSGTDSRVDTRTDITSNNLPDGSLGFLITDYHDRFDTWSTDLKADGSLFTLPSGHVRLAVGASYREDTLQSSRIWVLPPRGFQQHAAQLRGVSAVFGELFVPIVGREQGLAWAKRLELSVAARHDDYSDFGGTSNPKVGLVWSPIERLDIRASYGTSFRAPTGAEQGQLAVSQISTTTVNAPDGSGAQVPIFLLNGSAVLNAERAKNTTTGFTFRPATGLEVSFNYYRIDYANRISMPPFDQDLLLHSDQFGSLISNLSGDAAAQAYLNSAVAAGDLFRDFLGNGATGVRYVVDLRQQNAARTKTSGFDLTTNYIVARGNDTFNFNLNLTHINTILDSLTSTSTPIQEVNTFEQPLAWRARLLSTWIRGAWNTTLALNYAGSYLNNTVAPNEPISSWTTADLNLIYKTGGAVRSSYWRNLQFGVGVSNLFNSNPPRATDILSNMGFDVLNANAMGRYLNINFSKGW